MLAARRNTASCRFMHARIAGHVLLRNSLTHSTTVREKFEIGARAVRRYRAQRRYNRTLAKKALSESR
eukprot:2718722-Amphidinium_carterae.2